MSGKIQAAALPPRWRQAGWAVAALIALGLPLVLGEFWLFLTASIMALGIYGAAYDLAYGYTGMLSFGHAVFFGVGAYVAAFAVRDASFGALPALGFGFVAALLVALLLGVVLVRVSEHGFVILTIIFVLIANLVAVTFSEVTRGTDGFTVLMPPITLGGLVDFPVYEAVNQYYFILALLAGTILVLRRLVNSPVGLTLRMIRDNEQRARMLGYDTTKYKLAALGISGAFSGLAGALEVFVVGYINTSNFSLMVSADPLVFTLLGGRGTIIGPVIGAIVVDLFAELVSDVTEAYPLFIGALLVVVVVVERGGLIGAIARLRERYRDREDGQE